MKIPGPEIRAGAVPQRGGFRWLAAGLPLVLLAVAGLAVACVAPPATPGATSVPATLAAATAPATAAQVTATSTTAPVAASTAVSATGTGPSLPVGVDADGNFYRGNRNASVKLIDFSDFQ